MTTICTKALIKRLYLAINWIRLELLNLLESFVAARNFPLLEIVVETFALSKGNESAVENSRLLLEFP